MYSISALYILIGSKNGWFFQFDSKIYLKQNRRHKKMTLEILKSVYSNAHAAFLACIYYVGTK